MELRTGGKAAVRQWEWHVNKLDKQRKEWDGGKPLSRGVDFKALVMR